MLIIKFKFVYSREKKACKIMEQKKFKNKL